ncbi:aspartate aminotransferase [Clostridium pasteurianum DSM 525 = ATCC 6013]|uniref:Aminotransferase n=1 Tax=Clostridium pasteurianum DSM 525 = ATCC 6013 TaxID=1262449 RepID=A0A0H3J726_CLOPA|nr:pyridoxal phosphate-dependent aminotransferase [Clostridium pasteurianum]AJA49017.1 aspartate aminotransferase [Clostridium pasteurianum DSM 525 = ATCC 6013]AJA53005.1 aspartate aminotransferase [Clostridium pasteurianum DSM 525 = ATCC 6013]AOZ76223.1 aspartate aminotransferase [Clostridium pasteurianum DSM 525 = ATCC 6013]AOZ80019.1 aspartate aminotransferase [Clostridium pasteurianum]ELP60313.1 aspartate aminotransferase [Clostridium pasteurianum DSM 525 = ATCC 6013]
MISKIMMDYVANSSVIRAMFEEGKKLSKIYGEENVFDFSLGNPNVEPPDSIKKAVVEVISEESPNLVHGYMSNSGYLDVRASIADNICKKHNINLNEDNIVMTCGAAGGLNILLKTLLDPGDEVISFSPFFGEYANYVRNFNGKLVISPSNIDTFQPDLESFKDSITAKTKAVIINSPNNPTGVVYSEDTIKNLSEILEEKQRELGSSIYLISDEPYREIVYDGVKVPYILKYYKNSFIAYSFSKSLSLPGERIGYIVCHSEIEDFNNVIQALNVANRILGFVNAPSLFQRVIGKCLDSEVDINIYKKNRDLLYNHLIKIGFSCVKPDGAFYLFPKSLIPDDREFAKEAKKFNLLIVPGSTFGCPEHFRLSYCISYDKIERSLPQFDKLAQVYLK